MKKLFIVCMVFLIPGCLRVPDVRPMNNETFEIHYQITFIEDEGIILQQMRLGALAACPAGYNKLSEKRVAGNPESVTWVISCL